MNLTHYSKSKTIKAPGDFLWTPESNESPCMTKARLQYLNLMNAVDSSEEAFFCILSSWEEMSDWKTRGTPVRFSIKNDTQCAVGIGGSYHLLTTLGQVENRVFDLPSEILELNWGKLEIVLPISAIKDL